MGSCLEALGLLPEYHIQDCLYFSLETLPPDVCRYWNLDGQCAAEEVQEVGAVDGAPVQEAVPGEAYAGVGGAEVGDWLERIRADGV